MMDYARAVFDEGEQAPEQQSDGKMIDVGRLTQRLLRRIEP